MQVDAQQFLRLVEAAGTLGFVDIEATGLRGDYNSVLVVSVRRFGGKPVSFSVKRAGLDKDVVLKAKSALEELDVWCTYYGKGFDIPMLNTRLLQHGARPIEKRHHIDLYYTLKANLLTARRSQGHLLSWLHSPAQKMGVSAEVWNQVLAAPRKAMPEMIARCESDTEGLAALYNRTKHLIVEVTR